MSHPYEENMTQEMIDCIISETDLIDEYKLSMENYNDAKKASDICLPATATSGEKVLHGARLVTHSYADYWHRRANLAAELLFSFYNRRCYNGEVK